jgi:hypothetical protein
MYIYVYLYIYVYICICIHMYIYEIRYMYLYIYEGGGEVGFIGEVADESTDNEKLAVEGSNGIILS